MIRVVPVKGCAVIVHRDQHVHIAIVAGDGTAGTHNAGYAPVVANNGVVFTAAGSKAQAKSRCQQKRKVLFQEIHRFRLLSLIVYPVISV